MLHTIPGAFDVLAHRHNPKLPPPPLLPPSQSQQAECTLFSIFYKSFSKLIIYFSIESLCTIHWPFDVSAHRSSPKSLPPIPPPPLPPISPPPQTQQAATVDEDFWCDWIAFSRQKCRHVGFFRYSFKYNPTRSCHYSNYDFFLLY